LVIKTALKSIKKHIFAADDKKSRMQILLPVNLNVTHECVLPITNQNNLLVRINHSDGYHVITRKVQSL